ncbi:MAG: TfoX/Sxy family protein [Bauldia sp.]
MTTAAQMEELFASIEGTTVRRMFGGLGVFRQGLMYALVADDVLYLKGDAGTQAAFEREDCPQWIYDGKQRPVAMPYWRLPERLYDEPDEFREWALAAFAVAERTAKPKAGKTAKPGPRNVASSRKPPAKAVKSSKADNEKPALKPAARPSRNSRKG